MSGGVVSGGKATQAAVESADATTRTEGEGLAAWRAGRVAEAVTRLERELMSVEVDEGRGYEDRSAPLPYLPVRERTRRELLAERLRAGSAPEVATAERIAAGRESMAESASVARTGRSGGGVGGRRRQQATPEVPEASGGTQRRGLSEATAGRERQQPRAVEETAFANEARVTAPDHRKRGGERRRGTVEAEDELRLELVR